MKKKCAGIIVLVLLVSGFGIHRLFRGDTSATTTHSNVVQVSRGNITEKVIAVGNIIPKQSIEVKSPIAGTVARIFHHAGDYVKKGTPLLEVKPEPTPDEYASAKQQVEIDKISVTTTATKLKSYAFLLKKGAIAPDDQNYVSAEDDGHKARLTLELDQEKLALLERGKAVIGGRAIANIIPSPASGYILERNVDLGGPVVAQSSAQAGNTLFVIANMDDLIFKGQVSEIDAAKIHLAMPATLKIAALPKIKITGILTRIALQSVQANAASSGSNTSSPFNVGFNVEVTKLHVPKGTRLLAGYSATADITVKKAKNTRLIPERALQFKGNKIFVWLPGKDASPATKQFITTGISNGMKVQVIKGLIFGQTLFISLPHTDANNETE